MFRIAEIWQKVRKFYPGGSSFSRDPLGLQTRITLLFAVVVVVVLVLFSYLEFRLSEHSQREVWRERTIYVTREVDAKIYSPKDLENAAFLEEEIANWMYAALPSDPSDIFVFQKNTYKVVASSWMERPGNQLPEPRFLKRDMVSPPSSSGTIIPTGKFWPRFMWGGRSWGGSAS